MNTTVVFLSFYLALKRLRVPMIRVDANRVAYRDGEDLGKVDL